MIKLENVTKIYGDKDNQTVALDNVSLTIKEGEMVAIMGPSGSGKSTMLNIIGAMDLLTEGDYYFNDINVGKMKMRDLHVFRKNNVSFVFQNFALMNNYTVYENVELPLLPKKVSAKERKKIVNEQLELMGIAELKDKYPTKISGGQQQRCAIARALASGNSLILADEPTGALDKKTGEDIMEAFRSLNKAGKTIIVITHDEKVAAYADRTIYIEDGKIRE